MEPHKFKHKPAAAVVVEFFEARERKETNPISRFSLTGICFQVPIPVLLADCITRLLARYEHLFSHQILFLTEFKINLCLNRYKYYNFLA
jgi:hypothetical protein